MSDRHEQQARLNHSRQDVDALERDIRHIMDSPEGRRVYEWLRSVSGVWDNAPQDEPARTAFLGHRALGLAIVRVFEKAAPELCHLAVMDRLALAARREDEIDQARRLDEQEAREDAAELLPNNPNP